MGEGNKHTKIQISKIKSSENIEHESRMWVLLSLTKE